MMKVSMIAAIAENGAIGYKGGLLYRIPSDLKRFRQLTYGRTVIMGRKTWDSLPFHMGLPGRRNIVLTSNPIEGVECVSSLSEALNLCSGEEEVFIIGGANVYKQALPIANKLYLTLIHDSPIAGKADTFFPIEWIERFYTHQTQRSDCYEDGIRFSFIDYEI